MTFHIITGNCLDVLRELEAESVHCVSSSPPYYGLRDYNIPPTIWGGDPKCEHVFIDETIEGELRRGLGLEELSKRYRGGGKKAAKVAMISATRGTCIHCGAWRGNFGLEPTPDLFIEHLVLIFEEVRRVLRKDGTLWLNLGDSYYSPRYPGGVGENSTINGKETQEQLRLARRLQRGGFSGNKGYVQGNAHEPHRSTMLQGLKPKDLLGIPWMAAFALRKAGWWLRSDVIWHKPNPMPESTNDRPTKSHEYLFLLTKSEHYFYDAEAIKEDASDNSHPRKANGAAVPMVSPKSVEHGLGIKANESFHVAGGDLVSKRNKRSVWTVATQPFAEAHFATFPPDLIEPCILAGTSERGCCPACMTGWERITAPTARYAAVLGSSFHDHADDIGAGMMQCRGINSQNVARDEAGTSGCKEVETIGWYPSCKCAGMQKLPKYPRAPSTKGLDEATRETRLAPWRAECARITAERRVLCKAVEKFTTKRAVVLDPFGGAGTTALVADRLQRDSVLIELNTEYAEMARRRIVGDAPLFATAAE